MDITGHGQNSYTAAREAAAVANQVAMDAQTAEDAREEGIIRLTVRNQQRNMHREAAVMRAREARTTFEQQRLKREADLRC